jgi:branched-chain amino acid transport system ATP-binding protein
MSKCLYKVSGLTVGYNDQNVLENLSLSINDDEILILVGANGAGKSTLLKAMFGLIPVKDGEFAYKGEVVVPDPHMMVELGASFVPQNFRVFPEMTVEENLKIGAYIVDDKKVVEARLGKVHEIFPVLKKKSKAQSSTLSGGERQILALGRALMLDPDLLFLDEPSVGLAPKIVKDVFAKIKQINEAFGTSIVIVEHNLKSLLKIADRAVILVNGKIAKDGKPSELLESDVLEKVFFGELA